MEIKPLGTEDQILILKKAKDFLLSERNSSGGYISMGLCSQIQRAFYRSGITIPSISKIEKLIPIFTYENACKHSINTITGDYWWPKYDSISRLLFLDWMISELEKQLNK